MAGGSGLSQFDSSLDLLILGIMYHLHLGGGSIVLSLSYTSMGCLFWSFVLLLVINIGPTEDT
jgi:hypothetical protein